jgi:hypothetical protein
MPTAILRDSTIFLEVQMDSILFLTMAKCQKNSVKESDIAGACETRGKLRLAQERYAKIQKGKGTLGHLELDVRTVLK